MVRSLNISIIITLQGWKDKMSEWRGPPKNLQMSCILLLAKRSYLTCGRYLTKWSPYSNTELKIVFPDISTHINGSGIKFVHNLTSPVLSISMRFVSITLAHEIFRTFFTFFTSNIWVLKHFVPIFSYIFQTSCPGEYQSTG